MYATTVITTRLDPKGRGWLPKDLNQVCVCVRGVKRVRGGRVTALQMGPPRPAHLAAPPTHPPSQSTTSPPPHTHTANRAASTSSSCGWLAPRGCKHPLTPPPTHTPPHPQGRLDLFFLWLAGAMAVNLCLYLWVALRYEYKAVEHQRRVVLPREARQVRGRGVRGEAGRRQGGNVLLLPHPPLHPAHTHQSMTRRALRI